MYILGLKVTLNLSTYLWPVVQIMLSSLTYLVRASHSKYRIKGPLLNDRELGNLGVGTGEVISLIRFNVFRIGCLGTTTNLDDF